MSYQGQKLRVIDFFCGAGGFSEGFRQQGFEIVGGIDFWQSAIDTHNLNHGLNDEVKDVLDFWSDDSGDVTEIENLEDVEFLLGSPSCVSFSMSNRAGKADKTEGIRLIEAFLRVIAVKKHKKGSVLLAWYMENVPKSRDYVKEEYTFEQLSLAKWAHQNGFKTSDIALRAGGEILTAGDYGAPQDRKRFIAGEWVKTGEFLLPAVTRDKHQTSGNIRKKMPKVNELKDSRRKFADPNYPTIKLPVHELTDHFYDTGVYRLEWEKAEFLKINHPFMGKMSFPENEERASRTIMATRSASTREAILYKSEYERTGNGEYRLPTIRELASLMGFPYVYQFCGSEGAKWKQIGNSVCPHQSAALARALRNRMGLDEITDANVVFSLMKSNFIKVRNLNTFSQKKFDSPRRRNKDARFRRHILKAGNMTINLMNYHPERASSVAKDWYVAAFFGTGHDYEVKVLNSKEKNEIENILWKNFKQFDEYKALLDELNVNKLELQHLYEEDLHLEQSSNPINLLKKIDSMISSYEDACQGTLPNLDFFEKRKAPLVQLISAYSILSLLNY